MMSEREVRERLIDIIMHMTDEEVEAVMQEWEGVQR